MRDNWQPLSEKSRRIVRMGTVFGVIAIVMATVGIGLYLSVLLFCTQTYIAVANTTPFQIERLSIQAGGSVIWEGRLEAGESFSISQSPRGNGEVSVSAMWRGENIRRLDCVSMPTSYGTVYDLKLLSDGAWSSRIEYPNPLNMLQWLAMRRNKV
jgi:hypothetical protein